jgi:hypothetical protein
VLRSVRAGFKQSAAKCSEWQERKLVLPVSHRMRIGKIGQEQSLALAAYLLLL